MSGAQLTFYGVLAMTPLLAAWLYPGVRVHARSRRDSALAALMAAALTTAGLALAASWTVHVVGALLPR